MSDQIKINNAEDESCKPCPKSSQIYDNVINILLLIATIYAIYLSIKRNNGFNFGSFLVALFFGPYYIVYNLAVKTDN